MSRQWVPTVAGRGLVLVALWWAAAEGRPVSWPLAILAITIALWASVALRPPTGWSLGGFARFAAFFLVASVRGGIDVAWRAVRPGPPLHPGFLSLPLRVTDPHSRLVVTRTMSLLPGTLGVHLDGDRLTLHVLDLDAANERTLRRCEHRVAALHGSRTTRTDG